MVDLAAIRRREAALGMEQMGVIGNRCDTPEDVHFAMLGALLKEARVTNALLVELIKATGK